MPDPVTLICGLLGAGGPILAEARDALRARYGAIALESPVMPFTFTDYYREEMGAGLLRQFAAFETRIDPARLSRIKRETNELERVLSGCPAGAAGRRRVNLDPGYVTPSKLILATTKDFAHRVYLGEGIYAEVTLAFTKSGCRHFEWTYPDYRTEAYAAFFRDVRRLLMAPAARPRA
jgi:hypothetical protein